MGTSCRGQWNNAKEKVADAETDVSFSGDRGDVCSTHLGKSEITLYFQNTGVRVLDKDSFTIFVDGVSSSVVGSTLYPANGVWATDYVMEVTVTDASFSYSDNDLATVTIIAQSTVTDGVKGTDSETAEVRLSV